MNYQVLFKIQKLLFFQVNGMKMVPIAAIEAMAYSKPLIVSNVGGLPEMVDDNVNGYVFDMLNVEMLSDCINKMQNLSLNDYSSMCLASYKKYKTNYCMENYVKSLINYILKL